MNKLLLLSFACLSLAFLASCTFDKEEEVVTCDAPLTITLADRTPSACGIASGSFMVATTGGAAGTAVEYTLNGGAAQTDPTFAALTAGVYTLQASQGVCEASLQVTIDNAEGLNVTASAMPSACGAPSGQISLSATDASGAVSYSLNGGTAQADALFTDLAPGVYEIVAEDAIGCRVTLEATVLSDVAYAAVESIVTSSCAVSGCHAGNVSPDFREKSNIVGRANRIMARTGNASMPPPSSGRSLAEAEIQAIACWVNDGAPE